MTISIDELLNENSDPLNAAMQVFNRLKTMNDELVRVSAEVKRLNDELENMRRAENLASLREKFVFDLKKERRHCRVERMTKELFEKRMKKLTKTSERVPESKPSTTYPNLDVLQTLADVRREMADKVFWGLLATKFPSAPIAYTAKITAVRNYALTLYEPLVNAKKIDDFLATIEEKLENKK